MRGGWEPWFAWRPVILTHGRDEGGIRWLRRVNRTRFGERWYFSDRA